MFYLGIGELVSIILHNIISGLAGVEEIFFFLIAVLFIPGYLILSFFVSVTLMMKKEKNG